MMLDSSEIEQAARLLEQGKLVAFPTETVYGLGADATNPEAVAAIFAAKGRPSNHPLIVHVAHNADVERWASHIPAQADSLMKAFWPGPLTLILPRSSHVPAAVAGGQNSIGLRCPSHPVARALIAEFQHGLGGIAAPSANRFGHVSPTTAQHVLDEFGDADESPIAYVLDGGQSEVGIESTIVDLTRLDSVGPVVLRPGQIGVAQLAQCLGHLPMMPTLTDADAPRVSGSLVSHYAPITPLVLIDSAELVPLMRGLESVHRSYVVMHYSSLPKDNYHALAIKQLPADANAYAHGLYAGLRLLDTQGADVIIVERPPLSDEWQGINDRLRRAAFESGGIVEQLLKR
jgi:L-threonylcarbamoyladenylate synthase